MSHSLRDLKRIRNRERVEGIFTLGSLQFSDAWPQPLAKRLRRAIRFHAEFANAKRVFFPSTWGPFTREHGKLLRELTADGTVLARDTISAAYLDDALGGGRARFCPDLAFLLPEEDPAAGRRILRAHGVDPARSAVGIIPNMRCVQPETSPLKDPGLYLEYLEQTVAWSRGRGLQPVGISHMVSTDRDSGILGGLDIPVVRSNSRRAIRSVIANLAMAVCSRYHGLVNCLVHRVPAVALGWQHKYDGLMLDFDLREYNYSLVDPPGDLPAKMEGILENASVLRAHLGERVAEARRMIEAETHELQALFRR